MTNPAGAALAPRPCQDYSWDINRRGKHLKPLTFGLAALLLLSVPRALPAQDDPCSTRTVFASVVDKGGLPVSGLTAANFRAKIRGQPVEILSAVRDLSPRRIVLVLDVSGSVASGHRREVVGTLAEDLFRYAPVRSSLAMVIFASTVIDSSSFADGPVAMARKLSALRNTDDAAPKGFRKTALYDAILRGLAELVPRQAGDVIFAITDGGDNASAAKWRDVEEALASAKVRLFATVLTSVGRFVMPEDDEGSIRLRKMVKTTGGDALFLRARGLISDEYYWRDDSEREAVRLFARRLFQEMGECYTLEVRVPLGLERPRAWKLGVVDADGKPQRDLEVHYPQKLMPCNSDPKQD
jgi:hypothetical protein